MATLVEELGNGQFRRKIRERFRNGDLGIEIQEWRFRNGDSGMEIQGLGAEGDSAGNASTQSPFFQ